MKYLMIILGFLFTLSCNYAYNQNDPLKTLEKYLSLDYEGKRLTGLTNVEMSQLVTWDQENSAEMTRAEPGWDEVTLIDGYKISPKRIAKRKCIFEVEYHVIGFERGGVEVSFESKVEKVDFVLLLRDSKWYIDDPIIMPHVSVCADAERFKEQLEWAKKAVNPESKESLKKDLIQRYIKEQLLKDPKLPYEQIKKEAAMIAENVVENREENIRIIKTIKQLNEKCKEAK